MREPDGADFGVFSTSVEVFLSGRAREMAVNRSSPRPWRCFHFCGLVCGSCIVFSTSVEVFEHFGSWRDCCLLT